MVQPDAVFSPTCTCAENEIALQGTVEREFLPAHAHFRVMKQKQVMSIPDHGSPC